MSSANKYADFIADQQRQLKSAGLIKQELDIFESKVITIVPPKGEDHRAAVERIHKSIQNHPETKDMLTKHISGNSTQGFLSVKKKSDVQKVKDHIKKNHPGVKIVDL